MAGSAGFKELVLAADTTVTDGTEILGKPVDADDAARILKQLRGRVHYVHTAVVLFSPAAGRIEQELCSTRVRMRRYTDDELEAYVASGDPLDKAGAYAIQNGSFRPVEQFKGCYASVMGLPLCHVERVLRRMGHGERRNIPYVCQKKLSYICPIFQRVLDGEDIG
jgi:MAF protein